MKAWGLKKSSFRTLCYVKTLLIGSTGFRSTAGTYNTTVSEIDFTTSRMPAPASYASHMKPKHFLNGRLIY